MLQFFAGVLFTIIVVFIIFRLFFMRMFSIVNDGKYVASHLEELISIATRVSDQIAGRQDIPEKVASSPGLEELTPKQLQVLRYWQQGKTSQEIAQLLMIERDQVELIIRLIQQKY